MGPSTVAVSSQLAVIRSIRAVGSIRLNPCVLGARFVRPERKDYTDTGIERMLGMTAWGISADRLR